MGLFGPFLPPNPLYPHPRVSGGVGAEGMKKGMRINRYVHRASLMSILLRFSLIGSIALGLFGGMAVGQATPAGFSYIPGGSFAMGRTSGDTDGIAPSITVAVNPFFIQQTETTKAQWDEVRSWAVVNGYTDLVAGAGKSADHPVQTVSWWEVLKWCNARSEMEGLTPVYTVGGNVMRTGTVDPEVNWSANGYRLPTEAEWEKASRGGVSGKRFPWGTDTISHADANFFNDGGEPYQSGTSGHHPTYATGGLPYTSPVGSFAANGYGLSDMSGNVWEWCWDWFGSGYYATSDGTADPRGPASGTSRVFRGGSWSVSVAALARCANRGAITPDKAFNNVGFRVVRSHGVDGMALIPGGTFTMGRTSGDTDGIAPSITVAVNPFFVQQTETTKAQWDEVRSWAVVNGYTDLVAGAGKSADHPVQRVNWWEVLKWCNARSEKEGLTPVYTVGGNVMRTGTNDPDVNWSANGYRLPTEAEWEKASRGGVSGKRFPWGTDTISHADANFFNDGGEPYQSGTSGHHPTYATGGLPYTSPVGSFAANGYGLSDMSGNVWEWCWDWFGSGYYATSDGTADPRGPASGTSRVFRGGSWSVSVAALARCGNRGAITPDKAFDNVGFRVARSSVDSLALPSISDRTLTDVTTTGATLGANVTSDGGAAVTERGIVFSATTGNSNPLIGGSGVTRVTAAGTTGVFTVPVTGLTPGTSYHFKAYAINNLGTSYSSVGSFLTISNNSNLSGLVLDGFSFTPSFSGATTFYTATVQRGDGSVRIRPSVAHAGASLFAQINGGGWVAVGSGSLSLPLTLEFGDNLVEVRVVAQDGSTEKTYSLEVFRNDPRPDAMVGHPAGDQMIRVSLKIESRAAPFRPRPGNDIDESSIWDRTPLSPEFRWGGDNRSAASNGLPPPPPRATTTIPAAAATIVRS